MTINIYKLSSAFIISAAFLDGAAQAQSVALGAATYIVTQSDSPSIPQGNYQMAEQRLSHRGYNVQYQGEYKSIKSFQQVSAPEGFEDLKPGMYAVTGASVSAPCHVAVRVGVLLGNVATSQDCQFKAK